MSAFYLRYILQAIQDLVVERDDLQKQLNQYHEEYEQLEAR